MNNSFLNLLKEIAQTKFYKHFTLYPQVPKPVSTGDLDKEMAIVEKHLEEAFTATAYEMGLYRQKGQSHPKILCAPGRRPGPANKGTLEISARQQANLPKPGRHLIYQ